MEIVNMINEAYIKEWENNPWQNSPYLDLVKLTIDGRGKIGERIISNALKNANNPQIIIEEDISDVNAKGEDIHYDIKVNGELIEIKTAYRDKNNNWQHENLYKSAATMSIFVDFDYNGIYISIFSEEDLPLGKDSEIFGRKHGTLRKNKDDGYKLDFSRTTLNGFKKYEDKYSKYFEANEANLKNIGDFISERILNYVDFI